MKTLYLVRHAKSSWAEPGVTDFERPLNERGKRDAADMGRRLKEKGITFDQILSSPALRAKATAKLFARETGYEKDSIIWDKELYLASPDEILQSIQQIPDNIQSLAVCCHNPGITELANMLSPVKIDNMPTGAVFAITFSASSWGHIKAGIPTFLFFDFPKSK